MADCLHKFESMIAKITPPPTAILAECTIDTSVVEDTDGNVSMDDLTKMILALSIRTYNIVCVKCGMVANNVEIDPSTDSWGRPTE